MVTPVAGFMMGIALRVLVADGWWILRLECWLWKVGGMKGGDVELREKAGATVWGCCVGDDSGELPARDERSDDALWIDDTSLSVSRLGQNSMSSSRSKDRTSSNFDRKAATDAVSLRSFMLRTPRNCLCECCETESLGALRFRPWWPCDTAGGVTAVGLPWCALK